MKLESVLGMSAGEIEQQELNQGHVGFTMLHGLLWAGTRKHHRQDLRSTAELLRHMEEAYEEGTFDFQACFTACVEAYGAAQPKPKEQDQDKPEPGRRGKGIREAS